MSTDLRLSTPVVHLEMVHEDALPEIEARINRANAQARKLGVTGLAFRLTGKEKHIAAEHARVAGEWIPTAFNHYVEVEVSGEQPKLPGGWKLAAVVDYRQSVPQVSTVPGMELPIDPRGYGAKCDHCQTSRQRAEVFVLVNDEGKGTQVGRNCLGDFLGLGCNNPAAVLQLLMRIKEIAAFSEEFIGGFRSTGFDLNQIMFLAGAIVNINGWVSIARSEIVNAQPTSQRIREYLNPPNWQYDCHAKAEYLAWRREVNAQLTENQEALAAEVKAARAWAIAREPKSEFDREMADAARCDYLQHKYLGRAAYILPAFRKEQERLKVVQSKRERFARSAHVGKVGERLELELELVSTKLIDGHFGTTTLATFDDGQGNQLKWFASNFPTWAIGEKATVKATVKAHDEYQGVKQTLLTRVR